jgi:cell division protein FtsI/penicillin-binding protein 2
VNIDFGIVKKYFSDRGFGFVTRTFLSSCQSEVFFHIRNVKKTRADLAEKLTKYESTDSIWFWYDTEITSKGEQVHRILDSGEIQKMDFDNLPKIIDRIEVIWADVDSNMPDWLQEVTLDLLGTDRVEELSLERDVLEKEIRKIEKKRQKEIRKVEKKRQKQLKKVKIQKDIEEKEFEQLVAEMKVLGITESKDVSRHIMRNKLGHKYKNISGIVKMEHDGTVWDFKGGFPPQIYARLCNELGLRNQGTRARALSFKAFKDL